MEYFLKIKAWLLFLLVFGSQFIMVIGIIFSRNALAINIIFDITTFFIFAVFLAWFWTVGIFLNRKIPGGIRPYSSFFRFGIVYNSIYYILFYVLFKSLSSSSDSISISPLIFLFHIFAMICMFYMIYFVAKNLVIVEQNRNITFSDFAGPFFLIWFFPIGIWFIQPRINMIFQNSTKTHQ